MATQWFAVADAAISYVSEYGPEPEEQTRRVALDSFREGRKRLDRLAVVLGPGHVVVGTGARVLHLLDEAVAGLPDEWPTVIFDETDEAELAGQSEDERDEYRAKLEGEELDADVSESRLIVSFALEGWDSFAEAAALTLQRGILPRPRNAVAAVRRAITWVKFKRLERRHQKLVAQRRAEQASKIRAR